MVLPLFTISRFCRLPCPTSTDIMVHHVVTFIKDGSHSSLHHVIHTQRTSSSLTSHLSFVYQISWFKCGHNSLLCSFVSELQLNLHLYGQRNGTKSEINSSPIHNLHHGTVPPIEANFQSYINNDLIVACFMMYPFSFLLLIVIVTN